MPMPQIHTHLRLVGHVEGIIGLQDKSSMYSMQRTVLRLLLAASLASGFAGSMGFASAQHPVKPVPTSGALPAPGPDVEYVVRDRDTMIGITRRYLIDGARLEVQRALWEHNKLKDKDSIHIGQVIRMPSNWLLGSDHGLELANVEGDVQSKGQSLKQGAKIAPGDELRTGKDGYVVIKLADGSTLTLLPGSDMQIEDVRKSSLEPAAGARFMLKTGRVEASVAKRSASGARFEVRTPIAVAAVRGTKFRVLTDSELGRLTTEVLDGEVQVNDTGNLGSVAVTEGYGTRVLAGNAPAPPRALLPAPRLWTGIRLVVRRPAKLNFTGLSGAVAYRVLLARRADFSEVVLETVQASNEILLPDLPNGPYFMKVRGIDDLELEGRDAVVDLVLALSSTAPDSPPATPAFSPAQVTVTPAATR